MTRVHLLAGPPATQNCRAFLAPILANRLSLAERGIEIRHFAALAPELYDCDVLALSNTFWPGPWRDRRTEALELMAEMAGRTPRLVYFDRSSPPGSVNTDIVPLVSRYYKMALYRDRSLYRQRHYGLRLFTDSYHREHGIVDSNPSCTEAIDEAAEAKLRLAWNTGLANFSLLGPRLSTFHAYLSWRLWLRPPTRFQPPSSSRGVPLMCRMGLSYSRQTVAYQRQQIARLLADHQRTDRVSKWAYFQEMRNSRIVVSPFGYNEINYKDFETFICGALLLKPDMSHIETYPDYFRDGETFVSHSWSLDDVTEKVDEVLANYQRYLPIARAGQELYRHYVASPAGDAEFADRFAAQMQETLT
jgi:hypothetical protein